MTVKNAIKQEWKTLFDLVIRYWTCIIAFELLLGLNIGDNGGALRENRSFEERVVL